jgi:hypothetical protein
MKVVRFSALPTGHLYLVGNIPGVHWEGVVIVNGSFQ